MVVRGTSATVHLSFCVRASRLGSLRAIPRFFCELRHQDYVHATKIVFGRMRREIERLYIENRLLK